MDRLTTLIVGGVVALVIAGLAVAALNRGRTGPADLSLPEGVVIAYAQAEQRGDGQAAWDLLSVSAHARADRDRFIAHVGSGRPSRAEYVSTEPAQVDADGQAASVVLVRTFAGSNGLLPSGSSSIRSTVRLVRESGVWRISVPADDFALAPVKQP